MDSSTITTSTFIVSGVSGTVSYSGTTATFTPSSNLSCNTTYTATITTGVKDSADNTMASNYTWIWTTGSTLVTTTPTVTLLSSSPSNGATGVSVNTNVLRFIFSAPMAINFFTTGNYGSVSSNSWADSKTFEVYLSGTLQSNTLITITLKGTASGGFKGANGESFNDTTITFTTGSTPDTTAPTVSSKSPTSGATGVSISTTITATFSEAMDSSTITTSTFTVSGGVTGTVTYSGTTATFTPSSSLSYSTTYTATITTGVKDSAGNTMASSYTWSWTTSSAPGSNNANLSSLTVSGGVLNPSFSSGTTSYSSMFITQTSITVTPTAADSGATITVNGTSVASGQASGSISLSDGANTITIIVTAADSIATKTYTINANKLYQQAYVKASNTGAFDFFGNSVSISGDTLAVVADREDSNATGINGNQTDNSALESGAVYVFQ